MIRLFFICWLLVFSGCSMPLQNVDMVAGLEGVREQPLQNIRIERWGKIKFTGILGLKRVDSGLQYVLLDAMGVKLLQGYVNSAANNQDSHVTGVLAEKGLAPFLSRVLARIYLQEPVHYPCSSGVFTSLCVETGAVNARVKKVKMLGMTYWTVHQTISVESSKNKNRIVAASYSQPLVGVKVLLQTLGVEG